MLSNQTPATENISTTTFLPEQPTADQSVYWGGTWDPFTDTWTGGEWRRPDHGGRCQSFRPEWRKPAVIGSHSHWNGDYEMACLKGAHCPTPSCRPADSAHRLRTRHTEACIARADAGEFTYRTCYPGCPVCAGAEYVGLVQWT